jgi:threonine dehydratase
MTHIGPAGHALVSAAMNVPPDPSLPTIADVRRAAERLAGHAVRTPLVSSPALDERTGGRILLKCETLQRTGSFKFRGAYNALAAMSRAARERGVVAVSSGNHAQGVAEAARLFGVAATIVMPADAPPIKRARTTRSGGRIVDYDRARENREAVAARFIGEHGGALVHPFDDAEVIAGQGTAGLEIVADCAAAGLVADAIVIPCGGGGLSAGIGLAVRDAWSETEIVLSEPEGFDDYGRSLRAGEIVSNPVTSGSVCDALLA